MPELPEVETTRRDLVQKGLIGETVAAAQVLWPRTVTPLAPEEFIARITGRRIEALRRRGKYLVVELSGGQTLLIHLRMSGRLQWQSAGEAVHDHHRLILDLSGGASLRFHDTRKFGRVLLTADPDAVLNRLGPEPLAPTWSAESLYLRLGRHRRRLKPLLLDQGFLAGLGNIYADEALFRAQLHPACRADGITAAEAESLHGSIRAVLFEALENRGTSLGSGDGNYRSNQEMGENSKNLQAYDRAKAPCPRCGTPIERIMLAQRSTFFCPECQPAPAFFP